MVFVKVANVFFPISELVLYGAFEIGDELFTFLAKFKVPVTTIAYIVMSCGRCFYPKQGQHVVVSTRKGAIKPNEPRGVGRISTSCIAMRWR